MALAGPVFMAAKWEPGPVPLAPLLEPPLPKSSVGILIAPQSFATPCICASRLICRQWSGDYLLVVGRLEFGSMTCRIGETCTL